MGEQMNWDWLKFGQEDKMPLVTLSDKGRLSRKTAKYKDKTLQKINKARIISKNDLLNFAYLIGSYLGKDTDFDDTSRTISDSDREKYLRLIQALNRDVISILESQKPVTKDKSSAEYIEFYREPIIGQSTGSNDIQTVLRYISMLINQGIGISEQDTIDPIRMAIIRPIVKYEYKVNGRSFSNKEQKEQFLLDYSIQDAELKKIAKKEMKRVFIPTYVGYAGVGLGLLFITLTIINRRRR